MTPLCICKRCGHEWTSRIDQPKQCPRCKLYTWQIPDPKLQDELEVKEE